MARIQQGTTAKPPFTLTQAQFNETPHIYPLEVYLDGFHRVVHGPEEHYRAARDGWQEDREEDVKYEPYTNHPEQLEKAAKQLEAKKAADARKIAEVPQQFTRDDVSRMIQEALEAQRNAQE